MEFEDRLEALHKSTKAPAVEIDAAVITFERLKTAKAMVQTLFGDAEKHAAVVATVFSELSTEARLLFEEERRLAAED